MPSPPDHLSLFTLNLHGYHPMGEARRYREDRDGRIRPAGLYPSGVPLSFFTTDELDHGHRRRLDRLAADLRHLVPDMICLQEVAAGAPWTPRNRDVFLHDYPDDWFEANSALRLLRRLDAGDRPYRAALACRGNVGWGTGPFTHERIVTFDGPRPHILFDFDANPYPEGILVEGMAVLVREPWRVIEADEWNLTTNARGDRVFVQAVTLGHGAAAVGAGSETLPQLPWLLVANVHLGHKLAHFEQAVALRAALAEQVRRAPDTCLGVIVAGDFNAWLYRPFGVGEISTAPWEVVVPGQFDFRPERGAFGDLLAGLWALNDDSRYKPWATVRDAAEVRRRLGDAAGAWMRSLEEDPIAFGPWRDALEEARAAGRCEPMEGVPCAADVPERIDYVFHDPRLSVARACVVYPENEWGSLEGTSDHPAIYAEFALAPPNETR